MRDSSKVLSGLGAIVICGATWLLWAQGYRKPIAPSEVPTQINSAPVRRETSVRAPQGTSVASMQAASTANRDIPGGFKKATNYAEYADSLRGFAESGDPEAQFFLSQALGYCKQNLSRYFLIPGKPNRTLDTAQIRWATKGPGYQQEMMQQDIQDIYSRCHVYLEDPTKKQEIEEWTAWLDKASDNGYPPAQGLNAVLQRDAINLMEASRDSNVHSDPNAVTSEHDLALSALQSGSDPTVSWQMSSLVDERQQPQGKWGITPGAWRLLACEQGYDCSAQAEWLREACNYSSVCTPGESGQEFLKKTLGANYDEARAIADEIDATIKAKDWANLPHYLWDLGPRTQ